ncbi:MAG: hypothetical protein ETSY2_37160 [Candidatus Entotheonella gemina]|uniref:Uncharacterized protein n=1 Tax=Candidatus Entotheonella gemina TaxID=1429439 RepID=W4LU27_9BACT|nr:MAG: hypothetical protein ETSY2_37160 [Candidatus Entotheonella gemina]
MVGQQTKAGTMWLSDQSLLLGGNASRFTMRTK